jgi:DNA-binding protein YbaB
VTAALVADLARLQAQLEQLRNEVAQASSERPAAIDDIQVDLDDDGVATRIRVRSDELHRRDSAAVEAMVIAADIAAAAQFERSQRLRDAPSTGVQRGSVDGSLGDLTARTLAAFDGLAALTRPPAAVGADEPIRITVTSGRLAGCAIDRRWLAQATRSDLTDALNQALATARAAYVEVQRTADRYTHDLTGLLADLKATLRTFAEEG